MARVHATACHLIATEMKMLSILPRATRRPQCAVAKKSHQSAWRWWCARTPTRAPRFEFHIIRRFMNSFLWAWVAQSVQRLATGWTVRSTNSRSTSVQNGPGAHPASCTVGTGSLSRGQSGRNLSTTLPHIAPRLKREYSYTSTPTPCGIWQVIGQPLHLPYEFFLLLLPITRRQTAL